MNYKIFNMCIHMWSFLHMCIHMGDLSLYLVSSKRCVCVCVCVCTHTHMCPLYGCMLGLVILSEIVSLGFLFIISAGFFILFQYLYLEGNEIAFLPDEFFKSFPKLKWLDLRNNHLTRIPSIFLSSHSSLRNLLLQNNNLKSLPLELGMFQNVLFFLSLTDFLYVLSVDLLQL